MFTKLDELKKRYEFLSEKLADTEVLADMSVWQKYSKEQADLAETAEKYGQYLATQKEMQDAFALAETETDGEMKKLLTSEGYACKERLAELVNELKILLLPKDKNETQQNDLLDLIHQAKKDLKDENDFSGICMDLG